MSNSKEVVSGRVIAIKPGGGIEVEYVWASRTWVSHLAKSEFPKDTIFKLDDRWNFTVMPHPAKDEPKLIGARRM